MKLNKKLRLAVEQLEDRWVPTSVKLFGGTLFISNPTMGANGVAAVTITQTATGIQIATAGGSAITVGGADNIIYNGGLARNDFVFDANGNEYYGNLTVLSNNAHNDSITVTSNTGTGQIDGNVTLLTGYGTDSINVNSAATSSALNILGNVQIDNLHANATLTTGNSAAPTTVSGDFSAFGNFSAVTISQGSTDTFLGNVTIDDTTNAGSPALTIGNDSAGASLTIDKNLAVYGSGASNTFSLPGNLTVNGSTLLNLGGGNSQFNTGANTFAGSFNLYGGDGNDSITLSSDSVTLATPTFESNAAINLGNGDNSFALGVAFNASGNFTITAGNGDNAVGSATIGAENAGFIGGSLGLSFGNGDNDSITVNAPVGGSVFWRSGNGDSALLIGSQDGNNASNYNLNVLFGNGNDSFGYYLTPTSLINGSVNAGNGSNYFDPASTGTPTSTYEQSGF